MINKIPQSETIITILTKDDLDKFLDMERDLPLPEGEYKKEEPYEDNKQELMPPEELDLPVPEHEYTTEEPGVDNEQEIIPPVPVPAFNDPVQKTQPEKADANKSLTKADVIVNLISVAVIQHPKKSLRKD